MIQYGYFEKAVKTWLKVGLNSVQYRSTCNQITTVNFRVAKSRIRPYLVSRPVPVSKFGQEIRTTVQSDDASIERT